MFLPLILECLEFLLKGVPKFNRLVHRKTFKVNWIFNLIKLLNQLNKILLLFIRWTFNLNFWAMIHGPLGPKWPESFGPWILGLGHGGQCDVPFRPSLKWVKICFSQVFYHSGNRISYIIASYLVWFLEIDAYIKYINYYFLPKWQLY